MCQLKASTKTSVLPLSLQLISKFLPEPHSGSYRHFVLLLLHQAKENSLSLRGIYTSLTHRYCFYCFAFNFCRSLKAQLMLIALICSLIFLRKSLHILLVHISDIFAGVNLYHRLYMVLIAGNLVHLVPEPGLSHR
jgi:hypothetical protein